MRLETQIPVFEHQRKTGVVVKVFSKGGKPGTFEVHVIGPEPMAPVVDKGIGDFGEALELASERAKQPRRN